MPKRRSENKAGRKTPPKRPKFNRVEPQTRGQEDLIETIINNDIIICTGPPGSGKTFIGIALALEKLFDEEISRIVITRPTVVEGKGLGFLPGTIGDKMAPFLIPLYDSMKKCVDLSSLNIQVGPAGFNKNPNVEILPLEYMMGRTLEDSYIILDEAQNATYFQLKSVLTRIGTGSKIIINGDIQQALKKDVPLEEISDKLHGIPGIGIVSLDINDIVRHPIIERILKVL